MKELSLFIFLLALFFGLNILLRSILRPDYKDRAPFFIPSNGMFNLLWGSIFYIGYGTLIYSSPSVRFALAFVNGLLLVYTFFLLAQKRFIMNPNRKGNRFISHYLEQQIEAAKKTDNCHPEYSRRKALKILGLPNYAAENKELIQTRLDILKQISENGKLSSPYLKEIISKTEQALLG